MSNVTEQPRKREKWFDIARGICSVAVLLSHVPNVPTLYRVVFTPFMLPVFFFVSGYFSKVRKLRASDYLYYTVLRGVILKCIFAVSLTTFSLTAVRGLISDPSSLPRWLWDTFSTAFIKPRAIFFSVLALCSLYLLLIDRLCRHRTLPMLAAGLVCAAAGFLVSRERIILPWSWDTALVCVLFSICGFCAAQKKLLAKIRFGKRATVITGAAFSASLLILSLLLGTESICFTIPNNDWKNPVLSLLLVFLGTAFIICLSCTVARRKRPARLLSYIGRHSFAFFVFGGPVMAYLHSFLNLIGVPSDNGYLYSLLLTALSAGMTLPVCLFADRFCPVLNGRFKMPHASPRKYPGKWLSACAACLLLVICLTAAVLNGVWIPNSLYTRQYPVRGVDVSSSQGSIDWTKLEKQGIRFAFIRATEGSDTVDAKFTDNWQNVAQTGIAAGACHFFRFESSGKAQAEHFISVVPLRENSLPPVIALEYYGGCQRHPLPADKVVPELRELLLALEEHYGRRPVICVTEQVYLGYVYTFFDSYDIWLRSVVTDPPEGQWRFWQYTGRAALDGYDGENRFIDMDVFTGSEEEWEAFLRQRNGS